MRSTIAPDVAFSLDKATFFSKLSAMDVLARTTMKDAANCDTQCELQNSVNHQIAERKRRHQGSFLVARLFQCFYVVTKWDH